MKQKTEFRFHTTFKNMDLPLELGPEIILIRLAPSSHPPRYVEFGLKRSATSCSKMCRPFSI